MTASVIITVQMFPLSVVVTVVTVLQSWWWHVVAPNTMLLERATDKDARSRQAVMEASSCKAQLVSPSLTNVLVIIQTLVLTCATGTRPRQGDLHSTTA